MMDGTHQDASNIEYLRGLRAQAKRDREEADKYHGLLCIEIDRVKALRQQAQRTEAERAVIEAAMALYDRLSAFEGLYLPGEWDTFVETLCALRAAAPEGRQG